jgi:UDP-glucose 4-epimerase
MKNNNILITGGAGYIGSVVANLLIQHNYNVIIIDNLSTGNRKLINPKAVFYNANILDRKNLSKIFASHNIKGVIHLAGLSNVGESQSYPALYLQQNFEAGKVLLNVMSEFKCKYIIFSSTAAIYGEPQYLPIDENHIQNPISIYGSSKQLFEQEIIKTTAIKHIILRYFNAGGSSDCNQYGEIHDPETHLIPKIIKAVIEKKQITIYGNDYSTPDGTCIRDYIHVVDIANAHLLALQYLFTEQKSETINLGSGSGSSVKEIMNMISTTLETKPKIKIMSRRIGDPSILIANNNKAFDILKWKPTKTIYELIDSAIKFEIITNLNQYETFNSNPLSQRSQNNRNCDSKMPKFDQEIKHSG